MSCHTSAEQIHHRDVPRHVASDEVTGHLKEFKAQTGSTHRYDNCWARSEAVGHVNVHGNTARASTPAADLLERRCQRASGSGEDGKEGKAHPDCVGMEPDGVAMIGAVSVDF